MIQKEMKRVLVVKSDPLFKNIYLQVIMSLLVLFLAACDSSNISGSDTSISITPGFYKNPVDSIPYSVYGVSCKDDQGPLSWGTLDLKSDGSGRKLRYFTCSQKGLLAFEAMEMKGNWKVLNDTMFWTDAQARLRNASTNQWGEWQNPGSAFDREVRNLTPRSFELENGVQNERYELQ